MTDTANPGESGNVLNGVAFDGPAFGLAVGAWGDLVLTPMVQRWNGMAWRLVEVPETGHLGTRPKLYGVAHAGSFWAVGSVETGYPTDNMPLVLRWTGSGWADPLTPPLRKQTEYPYADRGGFAYAVDAVASDDVWVVGIAAGFGDGRATSVAMALHHDGSSWVDVPTPVVGNRSNHLGAVSASASDNVWAVGDWRDNAGVYSALVLRWDGDEWHHVPNPGEEGYGGQAAAVVALAPDDVWVSGEYWDGAPFLLHWIGPGWEEVDSGAPGEFISFAANGPDDIWATCAEDATFYHYDGNAWTAQATPDIPGATSVYRGRGMAALGPCEVWAVGTYSDGEGTLSLAEHLAPAGCPADFNSDGTANTQDVLAFLNAWTAGEDRADFNADGQINTQDVLAFLNAWTVGC